VRLLLVLLAAIVLALMLASWIGSHQLDRSTVAQVDALLHSADRTGPGRVDFALLSGLPEPVVRYLRHVLRDGQPLVEVARLSQVGELRTAPSSKRWFQFKANHVVVPPAQGFIWDARVAVVPLIHLRVRDGYARGSGFGRVTLLSLIPIGADSESTEINSGALHRYLAESVWYPTALLPSPALRWSPIDSTQAMATLSHAGTTVSLVFRFNDKGEVTGIYSPGRWGRFEGEYRQVPWEGHFRDYRDRQGMLIPTVGEVGWYWNGTWERVWEGSIEESSYKMTESIR
jgi:uncharacterized protein DUF6544